MRESFSAQRGTKASGRKQPEIGGLPGGDYTGVSVARERLAQLFKKDRQLEKTMERIRKELREA